MGRIVTLGLREDTIWYLRLYVDSVWEQRFMEQFVFHLWKYEMLSFFWLQTNFSFRCNIVNGTSTVCLAFPDSQKKLGQN